MNYSSVKTFFIIGLGLLIAAGIVVFKSGSPIAYPLILAGLTSTLFAIYSLASIVRDQRIFSFFLLGILLAILAPLIGLLLLFIGYPIDISSTLGAVIVQLLSVTFILGSGYFTVRSMQLAARLTGVNLFRKAGLFVIVSTFFWGTMGIFGLIWFTSPQMVPEIPRDFFMIPTYIGWALFVAFFTAAIIRLPK